MRALLRLIPIYLAALTVTIPSPSHGQDQAGSEQVPQAGVRVHISAALVDREMAIRPVPLHALLLIDAAGDTTRVRTSAEGRVNVELAPGSILIKSVASIEFQGASYSWALLVVIPIAGECQFTLSNDNVNVSEDRSRTPVGSPDESTEIAGALFHRYRHSVLRVESGLGHGTGFVADTLDGVVITNAHVLDRAAAAGPSIVIDDTTRVRAQVLARDESADIAILRLPREVMHRLVRIPIQRPISLAPVTPGERLIALGYPLHQGLTVTTGIASSVRAGAIISDVNINPGNSGGPLLNRGGEAIAVNTFGDFSARGGPGVAGSLLMAQAGPVLARASTEIMMTTPPRLELLPSMPVDRLDLTTVKALAEAAEFKLYEDFSGVEVAGFEVTIQTPVQNFVALKQYELEVAKDRRKREARAGLADEERYSEVRQYRDWIEYVGDLTAPVVSISVVPRVGETAGSQLARLVISSDIKAKIKFKGDVRDVVLFRDGVALEAIRGGHAPTKIFMDNGWMTFKDVADQGFYTYDVNAIRPDSLGNSPIVVVAIQDLKDPGKSKCIRIPSHVIAQAWNEFEQFFEIKRASAGFQLANSKPERKGDSDRTVKYLEDECDWPFPEDTSTKWRR